jgi:predicted tellurium resistance membrane protein TerC
MAWLTDYNLWGSFLSLTALEIILSIDNIVFVALVIQHLPTKQRYQARTIAVALALILRIAFLFSLTWIIGLSKPLFTVMDIEVTGREIFLIIGGLFLVYKATTSIHEMFTHEQAKELKHKTSGFWSTVVQAIFIDLIFSLDSIITAVGVTSNVPVIIAAMVISMIVMIFFVKIVSTFITEYPSLKMLAIAFILMIGVFLIIEGAGIHIPREYIYFAMFFSLGVETLNIFSGKRKK